MIDFTKFNSLVSLTMYFNDETICRDVIVETRWGKGEEQDNAEKAITLLNGGRHDEARKLLLKTINII